MPARVLSRFNNILLFQLYRLLNDQVNNDKLKPAQTLNVFLFLFFAAKKDVNTKECQSEATRHKPELNCCFNWRKIAVIYFSCQATPDGNKH